MQNYINHIAFVLDMSGSMGRFTDQVVTVTDNLVQYLATRSQELDQETRVSIYTFSYKVQCIVFDKDVLRLPSLKGQYTPDGGTALIDAVLKSQDDLADTSELYGDHAFLTYVITDGEENQSRAKSNTLTKAIQTLPDHWTVAVLVPNQQGVFEAKKFGFPPNNIAIWDTTTVRGLEVASNTVRDATAQFMEARSKGSFRGTSNLFNMSSENLNPQTVKAVLQEVLSQKYFITTVNGACPVEIRDFVESTGTPYVLGIGYYQLTKPEKVQTSKNIAVYEKSTRKVYSGNSARSLLGLPSYEVTVKPHENAEYDVFIQSKSVNRKLVPGTKLLIFT